jgi:hypothetical protein
VIVAENFAPHLPRLLEVRESLQGLAMLPLRDAEVGQCLDRICCFEVHA